MQQKDAHSAEHRKTAIGHCDGKISERDAKASILLVCFLLIKTIMGKSAVAYSLYLDLGTRALKRIACFPSARSFEKRFMHKYRWYWNPGIEGTCPTRCA